MQGWKFVRWLSFYTCSAIADTSVFTWFTASLCLFKHVPKDLKVCPTYTAGHITHGMQYARFRFVRDGLGSFGWTRSRRSVVCGWRATLSATSASPTGKGVGFTGTSGRKTSLAIKPISEGRTSGLRMRVLQGQIASTCWWTTCPESNSTWYDRGPVTFTILPTIHVNKLVEKSRTYVDCVCNLKCFQWFGGIVLLGCLTCWFFNIRKRQSNCDLRQRPRAMLRDRHQ